MPYSERMLFLLGVGIMLIGAGWLALTGWPYYAPEGPTSDKVEAPAHGAKRSHKPATDAPVHEDEAAETTTSIEGEVHQTAPEEEAPEVAPGDVPAPASAQENAETPAPDVAPVDASTTETPTTDTSTEGQSFPFPRKLPLRPCPRAMPPFRWSSCGKVRKGKVKPRAKKGKQKVPRRTRSLPKSSLASTSAASAAGEIRLEEPRQLDTVSATSALSTEMRTRGIRRLRLAAILLLGPPLLLLAIGLNLYFRTNESRVSPSLLYETWPAISDGMHNTDTDLIFWRDSWYLVHVCAPSQLERSESRLTLWKSADCRNWAIVREFRVQGHSMRAPKFAPISGRLILYMLKNRGGDRDPYATQFTYTESGHTWEPLHDAQPEGWLFWRPKALDGRVWYVPAYWHEHGKSVLLTSRNGQQWQEVCAIHEGNRAGETDIAFLPDGRMLATARLDESESIFGDKEARTLIAVAEPPYTQWSKTSSYITRLDGPCLFTYNGQVYGIGRGNPDPPRPLNYHGGVLGRKRTAIYRISPDGMEWLTDLPSAGDTSYAGAVQRGEELFVSYYTSPATYDWPWLFGMMQPSDVMIAKISLPSLEKLP